MMGALTLFITLGGGLWPFAGERVDDEATLATLRRKAPVIAPGVPVEGGVERARGHYEAFLELPQTPTGLRAESMRRLADLHLRAAEEADLAADAALGAREYRQAADLYHRYLGEFPGQDAADAALYSLARAHEGLGDNAAALAVLDELLVRHPASTLAAEAQFRRGERLFMSKDWMAAERAYAAVVVRGAGGEFFEQALYKQGWARFKLGEYEACLDPFLQLIGRALAGTGDDAGRRPLAALPTAERELAEDSLRAMSLAVSQLEGIASVDALLDRQGEMAFADVIYAGLGDLYLSQERFGDAAEAYRGFVRRAPTHARAPYLHSDLIRAQVLGKFPSRVLEAKAEFVTLYGLDSPYWQGVDPATRPEVVAELKQSLADLASHDHERAQRSREPQAYRAAAHWYRLYLAWFPADAQSAERNFLLAEVLYESGDFAAAAVEYRRAAYDYGEHAQAAEAGFAALLAGREWSRSVTGAERAAWQGGYIEEELRFSASFPGHPQALAVQTAAAEQLFATGAIERALEVAAAVVARDPPAELARVGWTVLAHGQFDLGRYAGAEQAYARLRDLGVADAARRAEIEERIAASVYRQAEQLRAAGEESAAVAEFLRVAEAAPGAQSRSSAVYDAAALLVGARRWGEAVVVLERFQREFPDHALGPDVAQQLAVALESEGRLAEAAVRFEAVAALEALGEDLRREALWRAADLYRRAGALTDSRRVYAGIVARHPQPFTEAMEARATALALAIEAADDAAVRHWREDIIAADAAAGAARSDRSRTLAAHAALDLATPLRESFIAVRLEAPLARALKVKKQRMELALAAYAKAAGYAVAEVTTAATYETAELYVRLARDLLDSERPAGLDAEALEEYVLLLEEQAFPFEEKAIELHAVNTARTADGVFDQWVRRSFARLAELSPARFAREERSERYVAIID